MSYTRPVGSRWKCEVRVTVDGEVHKDNHTFDHKAAAEAWGRQRDAELKAMQGGGFPAKTVRQLLTRWREEVAPSRDGARWDVNRLKAIEARLDVMGLVDMRLADFGPKQMAAVRRARLAQISAPSVSREEALLKTVWATARHPDWSWTDANPFLDLGRIKGSKGVARRRKATWPELKRILRQLGYHPRQPEQNKTAEVGLAVMLALRTTLRSQEVLQLDDGCIDLKRLVLSIPQHKTRYITQQGKAVPIMPKALALLARKCLGRGRYFSVTPGSRDALYRKAKILAMVPDLTFHDLKRTSVMMLKSLLTEDELMAVTGNADVAVLRRHYMTDTAAEASKAVWRALGADRSTAIHLLSGGPSAPA